MRMTAAALPGDRRLKPAVPRDRGIIEQNRVSGQAFLRAIIRSWIDQRATGRSCSTVML